jgi:hypothetical protein
MHRPYNPNDPSAGLPKECVNCNARPATPYTADGPMVVLCDTCKAELPTVPLAPLYYSETLGRFVTIPGD